MAGGPGGPARGDDDAADFLEFAAAHESHCLQVATLLTGSEQTGRRVALDALTRVAVDWAAAREEGPDGVLRKTLYRRSVVAAEHEATEESAHGTAPGAPRPGPSGRAEAPEVLEAARRALAQMPPPVRAVALLHVLEERAAAEVSRVVERDAAEVALEVRQAREGLAAVLPETGRDPTDDQLRDLLEELAEAVPGQALAAGAWAQARRRSTVRRRGVLAGMVLAGGAAATLVWGGDETDGPSPSPSSSPSGVRTDGRLQARVVAGSRVLLAPGPDAEGRLPLYPYAGQMVLPGRFGPGTARPLTILSPAGSGSSVRAVYLVRIGEDRYQPAVYLPRQSTLSLLVAMPALGPVTGAVRGERLTLGPQTIDGQRHRLVFPQPGAVVLLEVRSARTQRFPVPDDRLVEAGWCTDGETVVARSARSAWLLDVPTGKVTRAGGPVNAGWAGIRVTAGTAFVQSFSGSGRLVQVRSMSGPELEVYGASVSNTEGWTCRGAFFSSSPDPAGRMQGLVAVQGDLRPVPRILAAPSVEGEPLARYRPLGWGPQDTLLLESTPTAGGAARVLAWDVIGERLHRVAEVDEPVDEPDLDQTFTGAWAL